jgi:hypothetical protein
MPWKIIIIKKHIINIDLNTLNGCKQTSLSNIEVNNGIVAINIGTKNRGSSLSFVIRLSRKQHVIINMTEYITIKTTSMSLILKPKRGHNNVGIDLYLCV